MSLWWAKREQLDKTQLSLIEKLPYDEDHLVVGPPGSGKTNILLRRAQFVRSDGMPNVLVLTFTRPLTEFVKTGCSNPAGQEVFPRSLVQTIESWIRSLYDFHGEKLPMVAAGPNAFSRRKKAVAEGALKFAAQGKMPQYETIFVDEAQDLHEKELELIRQWTDNAFYVGDNQQEIYSGSAGLKGVRATLPEQNVHTLPFHYRVAPEIAEVADRILKSSGSGKLSTTGHYEGPKPGRVDVSGPLSQEEQLKRCVVRIKRQLRTYGDFFARGDRIGIIVARTEDREKVYEYFERDPDLAGRSQIIRARSGERGDDYVVGFEEESAISIVTVQGCKGLEFRGVHWLWSDDLSWAHGPKHYYTVVTRSKTDLDIYYTKELPAELAKSCSPDTKDDLW